MKLKEAKKTEYQQAKSVVATLKLHKEVIIQVQSAPLFRKYLRELSNGNQYVTKKSGDKADHKVKITRLK